eukprot:5321453-Amphidinium_carterae.1
MGEEAASIAAPHKKRTSGGIRWQQRHPKVRRARRAGGRGSCQSTAPQRRRLKAFPRCVFTALRGQK